VTDIQDGVIWDDADYETKREFLDAFNHGTDESYARVLYPKTPFLGIESGIVKKDGTLKRRLANSSLLYPLQYPLRADLCGGIDHRKNVFTFFTPDFLLQTDSAEDFDPVEDCDPLADNGGWKLHVSATPSSAERVAAHVLPYLERNGVYYKFIPSIPRMRALYLRAKTKIEGTGYSQYGKFITVYPQTPKHCRKIALDLDKILCNQGYSERGIVIPAHEPTDRERFTEKDFPACSGDFSIGESGGLSTRYVVRYGEDDAGQLASWGQRRAPVICEEVLDETLQEPPMDLSYCGISFPKATCQRRVRLVGLVNPTRSFSKETVNPMLMQTIARLPK
jgi:hypothetical protein